MQGLLADGWFYISAAGLLVSGVLFFFLLGQYRAAAEAADGREPEAETTAPLVTPILPKETPAQAASADKTEILPPRETPRAALPPPAPAPAAKETTTGGISPAVVYLQNIKSQLDELTATVKDLSKRVDGVSGRDEALVEKLGELTQAIADLRGAPGIAPAPAETAKKPKPMAMSAAVNAPIELPKRPARADLPMPAPAAVTLGRPAEAKPEPKAEPKPEPKVELAKPAEKTLSPDETVRLGLDQAISVQLGQKAEAAPAEPAAEPEEKPRRGPVWPI